jgi:hypothetical protein
MTLLPTIMHGTYLKSWTMAMSLKKTQTQWISIPFLMDFANSTSAMLEVNSRTSWRRNCTINKGASFFNEFIFTFTYHIDRRKRTDPRSRRNRTELRNQGFKIQIEGIVDGYIAWQEAIGDKGLDATLPSLPSELVQGDYEIQVVDVFCKYIHLFNPLHLLKWCSYIFYMC